MNNPKLHRFIYNGCYHQFVDYDDYKKEFALIHEKLKYILSIPHSVDYEEDPCGQVNKMYEEIKKLRRVIA